MMTTSQLITALSAIATANTDGFTVNANTLQPITTGYAVAVAATQNSFGPEGLAKVVQYVQDYSNVSAFGGWYNSEDGQYYFDATVIVATKAEAVALAQVNKQMAFFCLDTLTEYDQDGNEKK